MILDREPTKKFIQKTAPFDDLTCIRSMFLDFFKGIYLDDPYIQNGFKEWTNPNLVKEAIQSGQQARNFDPHKEVNIFVNYINRVSNIIYWLLAFLLIITTFVGLGIRSVIESWFSTGISLFAFLPPIVVAFLVFYLGILKINTPAIQVFNENLSIGNKKIHKNSRNRSNLVSYFIWNESLQSQKFPSLLALCYILEQISNLPLIRRWMNNPTKYILQKLNHHWEVYKNNGGYIKVIRTTFNREMNGRRHR